LVNPDERRSSLGNQVDFLALCGSKGCPPGFCLILEHSAAYILNLPRGSDTLFPGLGRDTHLLFSVVPPLGERMAPRGGPFPMVSCVCKVCPSKETPIGFYHEQTRVIKAVALLPTGCESMALQGIGPAGPPFWYSLLDHAGRSLASRGPSCSPGVNEVARPRSGFAHLFPPCCRPVGRAPVWGQGDEGGRFGAQGTGGRAVKCFDPSQDHQRRKH